jgi:hypothetical protein
MEMNTLLIVSNAYKRSSATETLGFHTSALRDPRGVCNEVVHVEGFEPVGQSLRGNWSLDS